MKVFVINGPNLNLLGVREPDIYGTGSYKELLTYIENEAEANGIEVEFYQSNHEGALIDFIQAALGKADGILLNPAAYTHTSIALADALRAVDLPCVEVHLTDINQREAYRCISYTKEAAIGFISGKGFAGYREGLLLLKAYLEEKKQ